MMIRGVIVIQGIRLRGSGMVCIDSFFYLFSPSFLLTLGTFSRTGIGPWAFFHAMKSPSELIFFFLKKKQESLKSWPHPKL